MGRVIAVVNQKGGVGKTTTSVSVAACAAESGRSVLLVDTDPESDSTHWLAGSPDDGAVMDVLTGALPLDAIIRTTGVPGLDLAPADTDLVLAERTLGNLAGAERRLATAIATVADRYDLVLVDCPPSLNLLTVGALVAADEVLVPVAMGSLEIDGLTTLLPTVELTTRRLNPGLRLAGVLPIKVRHRQRMSLDVLEVLRGRFGEQVLPPIRDAVTVAEAASAQQPITVYAPDDDITQDYRAATHALLDGRTR